MNEPKLKSIFTSTDFQQTELTAIEKPELTDGFHLVIDALKCNDIDTIFGLVGIPITDLARLAQAEGMRFIGFRHEQNAGNAAAIAGYMTQKPGVCLTVSAPGFLNGLTALANATTNCFPMILISGSSEREIVDLQQGDYEEMDQLNAAKPFAKAAYRVLKAEDIGIGVARAIRAAVSGRPGGVYLDLPAQLLGQSLDAVHGRKSLVRVRPRSAPNSVAGRGPSRHRSSQRREAAPHIARQRCGLCAGGRGNSRAGRDLGHPLLADVDGKGSAARQPSAIRRSGPLVCPSRGRCRPAHRCPPQLAAGAWQGENLGRAEEIHPDRHRPN